MDPLAEPVNTNVNNHQPVQEAAGNTPHSPVPKKMLLIGGIGLVILLTLSLIILLPKGVNKSDKSLVVVTATPVPTEIPSVELLKAIEEAQNSAKEYDNRQADLRVEYPWLRMLPLATEKYFVYFDLDKKAFIGRLYPKAGDNSEQLKTIITQQLKLKGVATESYKFEWQINPKN